MLFISKTALNTNSVYRYYDTSVSWGSGSTFRAAVLRTPFFGTLFLGHVFPVVFSIQNLEKPIFFKLEEILRILNPDDNTF